MSNKCDAHEESYLRVVSAGFSDFVKVYDFNERKRSNNKIVESVLDNMEDLVHKGVMVNLGVLSQFYNHHQIQICAHSLNINLGYLGHTSATVAQAESKKSDPGIIGLLDITRIPRPYYGIIYDVLVTNAMAAMGLPPGDYILVITIDACIRNFINFTGCSIVEAVETATLHPSELLGIQNIKRTLNIGAEADLIFLDDDLKVMKFFIAVYKPPTSIGNYEYPHGVYIPSNFTIPDGNVFKFTLYLAGFIWYTCNGTSGTMRSSIPKYDTSTLSFTCIGSAPSYDPKKDAKNEFCLSDGAFSDITYIILTEAKNGAAPPNEECKLK
ncbi:19956_t:CDS:2 [Gigaspora margarita]|uniref:19956_t:CDS:1 n=1 Tax=Gigaspora margarita TaxID=4874 RepID=A0ABN7UAB3_GIGMA|nr:19956_t:CDS:2 [Gigaspora margarita]